MSSGDTDPFRPPGEGDPRGDQGSSPADWGWGQQPPQQPGQQDGQQAGGGQPWGGYGQHPVQGAPGSYDQQYPGGEAPAHPRATAALVMGLLGILLCGLLSPFALFVGRKAVKEIDASNGRLGGHGTAMTGYVLGIIGTLLWGLGLLVVVVLVVSFIGFAMNPV